MTISFQKLSIFPRFLSRRTCLRGFEHGTILEGFHALISTKIALIMDKGQLR